MVTLGIMRAGPAAASVGEGTRRLISSLEEAGPSTAARMDAIAGWLPKGQRALVTPIDGGSLVSGGAGRNARQIFLYDNGATVVKAFNMARDAWEVVKTIVPHASE